MPYWAKTYGPGVAKAVAVDKNGDIIVAGYVEKDDKDDGFVARLDRDGNVKWFKVYDTGSKKEYKWDRFKDVKIASNGDIIVVGDTDSFGAGGEDVWVLRLDSNGKVKWQKTYGGPDHDYANAVAIAENGDIIVAGETRSFGVGEIKRWGFTSNVWVLRLDSQGNVKWQKMYGGSDDDEANAVAVAPNGDIIVAGHTSSFDGAWLLCLDKHGNVKWQKVYKVPQEWAGFYSVSVLPNGDIVVGGRVTLEEENEKLVLPWILKLDSNGNIKWQKSYKGDSEDPSDKVSITTLPDGSIVVATWTWEFSAGVPNVWVLRLDKNGNVKWQKTFSKGDDDKANAVAITPNEDIIVAGRTYSTGTGENIWLLRLPPDGNLPGCDFCNDSNAQVMDTNAEVHNTHCEVLSGVRKYQVEVEEGLIFKKKRKEWRTEKAPLVVMNSKATVKSLKITPEVQYYFNPEIKQNIQNSISFNIPQLVEGADSIIKLTAKNDFTNSLKLSLDLSSNDFLDLETTNLEFPELKKGQKVSKSLVITPKYAGSFDFRVKIKAIADGIELETEKVIPVEVAERTAQAYAMPQTPATPPTPQPVTPTPTPSPAGVQLPADFPPQLAYKYADVELIGKGGFARVYKAKRKDGKVVAVKIPLSLDENTGKAFLREITNWLHLKHPNIVRLYDANILPIPFLEMEYCESSLEKLPKPLPVEVASYIVFNIAEGLKYAHSKGIIHRDLKPSNILLKNGTPKISDWGLSKVMTETHSTTLASFTPFYASPEQTSRRFGKPDHRSDIWQLGVIFYQLVTGRLPFEGDDLIEVVSRIATDEPIPPGELNPEAKDVEHIILTCLRKDMEERYQSVAELQFELATYLGVRYKRELKRSITVNDAPRAAFYAGKLMLMFLKMGDLKEAYKYASDLKFYARGELTKDVESLAEQIKLRLEEGLSFAGEELLAKAEVIAHKVSLGFGEV
ncbi:protein kinase domain-containing protein [Thermococcus gammatolerans]|uniref:Serine/threonine protein kinase n=1 Tax=Thermococcus gammatolerans (strain DSM 15229 / JCM 11827 / EJ3) TaxID=593117 RepID=C5A5G4_THEGJ|nr:protein kinase [Thermococcus gammatolerans]ACS33476.1 Serine/threonine protein kinase [Thermococcus gammatolerans EJ3]